MIANRDGGEEDQWDCPLKTENQQRKVVARALIEIWQPLVQEYLREEWNDLVIKTSLKMADLLHVESMWIIDVLR